jgi:chemotaxis protein histidine kinase CheA
MPLVRCSFCQARVRPGAIRSHEKNCPKAKHQRKVEANKTISQSVDYRLDKLKTFIDVDFSSYDLTKMSDLAFNALLVNLEVAQKDKTEKENQLAELERLKLENEERAKKEKEDSDKKELIRKEEEEKARLKQAESENKKFSEIIEKKESLEKSFIEKREKTAVKQKTENELIKENIDKIDNLVNKSISSLPVKTKKVSKKK